jgi:hypothetical protein
VNLLYRWVSKKVPFAGWQMGRFSENTEQSDRITMNLATMSQSFTSFVPDAGVAPRHEFRSRAITFHTRRSIDPALPKPAHRRASCKSLTPQPTWIDRTEKAFWLASGPFVLALVLLPLLWR